jgi:Flp pilus assembly secretin CpaC
LTVDYPATRRIGRMTSTATAKTAVRTRSCGGLLLVIAALASVAPGVAVHAQDTGAVAMKTLVLECGKETILHFDGLRRVLIIDPAVADVAVLTADDLLVRSTDRAPLQSQSGTSLYVYDRKGLHAFTVTIVGTSEADTIARDLQQSLGPTLSVQVVSDRMVVVDGEVASTTALENLRLLTEAACSDDVRVVTMVTTCGSPKGPPAQAAAETLTAILDPSVQVKAWGEDLIVVEGELPTQAAVLQARREIATIAGDSLRVIDRITLRGADLSGQTPARQIQQLLGDRYTVTALQDDLIAVEGIASSQQELDRVERLVSSFGADSRIINLTMLVPPAPDVAAARVALMDLLGDGVHVSPIGEQALLIDGSVASEDRLSQVEEVLGLFGGVPVINAVTVVEPDRRRVLVAVKVLEVTRGGDKDLGIDWGQYSGVQFGDAQFRPQPFLFGQVAGSGGWPELYRFSTQVHALIAQEKARVLAEPNLLVNEQEDAEILIGGELPVPISQEGLGGFAAITVEWKPFGVNLKINPTISPDGSKVLLTVEPEVSSLDFGSGVTISGLTIPALRTRRTRTTVTVPDSGVLAIGGLISSDESESVSKIPILGDLPIVGQFFRHNTTRSSRSELIVLVLPQILNEEGQPLHPIPIPEGVAPGDVMEFGTRNIGETDTGTAGL